MKLVKEKTRSLVFGITAGLGRRRSERCIFIVLRCSPPRTRQFRCLLAWPLLWVARTTGRRCKCRPCSDEFNQVKKQLSVLGDGIAETQGLVQLSDLNQPYPLPFGGSWALTPDAAAILAREIAIRRPNIIVELGSGVSTLMVGRLLQQMGCGHLISLDHDARLGRGNPSAYFSQRAAGLCRRARCAPDQATVRRQGF